MPRCTLGTALAMMMLTAVACGSSSVPTLCPDCSDTTVGEVDTAIPPNDANPFQGASYYLNPDYTAAVQQSAADAPAQLRDAVEALAGFPTAIWLDRTAAIDGVGGRLGVRGHLDAAVSQAETTDSRVLLVFIIYNLPDRDCAALASNGELQIDDDGLEMYKHGYIDRVAAAFEADPAYRQLRIALVIEPDSLPNLVTNADHAPCAKAGPAYRQGIAYAISRFSRIANVDLYLDIGHSGWLGWEHPPAAAALYAEVLADAGGAELVRGFATNTSNYTPSQETLDPYVDEARYAALIQGFYEHNRIIDEHRFVDTLRGYFPDHHFIIDTSRNGWPSRGPELPRDARTHRGNWCNIQGAGVGERPRANPRPGVDAYFWLKPPGESDGTSDPEATEPNAEGKRHDPMCGQTPLVRRGGASPVPTDALPYSPHAGEWFHEQVLMLVDNATPPL